MNIKKKTIKEIITSKERELLLERIKTIKLLKRHV